MVGASTSEASGEGSGSGRNIFPKRQLSPSPWGNRTSKLSRMLLDPDSLHCPICYEVLSITIFQCDNGHLACSSCCPKLRNKCPSCALPIDHIRCRAMERVLESVIVPCRNAKFGCNVCTSYGAELTHEGECKFSLCSCPLEDCNYVAFYKDLYKHYYIGSHKSLRGFSLIRCGIPFTATMNISNKMHITMEYEKDLLFPVQCFKEPCGVYVTVSCIAPSAPEVGEFSYHISYTADGHKMTYESPKMKMVFEVSYQTPQEKSMLIPLSFLRDDDVLEMEICITKLNQDWSKYFL